MGKSSERAHFIKEVGSGKLAQDLKSKYIKATKSQFSRITKKTSKLSSTIKESLNLPKLKNLQNLKSNKELNESLNKWLFQEKSDDSDESDSKKLLYNGKAEKLAENIDDSSFCMKVYARNIIYQLIIDIESLNISLEIFIIIIIFSKLKDG